MPILEKKIFNGERSTLTPIEIRKTILSTASKSITFRLPNNWKMSRLAIISLMLLYLVSDLRQEVDAVRRSRLDLTLPATTKQAADGAVTAASTKWPTNSNVNNWQQGINIDNKYTNEPATVTATVSADVTTPTIATATFLSTTASLISKKGHGGSSSNDADRNSIDNSSGPLPMTMALTMANSDNEREISTGLSATSGAIEETMPRDNQANKNKIAAVHSASAAAVGASPLLALSQDPSTATAAISANQLSKDQKEMPSITFENNNRDGQHQVDQQTKQHQLPATAPLVSSNNNNLDECDPELLGFEIITG